MRNAHRIAQLLTEREAARTDLAEATSPAQADAARADLASLQHSLFLAGYEAEELV